MTTLTPIINDVITIPRNELIDPKINIIGLTKLALSEHLLKAGIEQKHLNMRLNQIWGWLYQKGITDFSKMGNISKDVKGLLSKYFSISLPAIVEKKISTDGTRKYLLRLSGGHEIETVFIPETDRGTLCISSQVGCTLTCPFCHTGTQKLVRNLNPSEMIGQVLIAREDLNEWPTEQNNRVGQPRKLSNIVLMGMGEPFYNYDNVKTAVEILKDKEGLNYGSKKITVSTAGIANKIPEAAKEIGTYLALSLHAPTDDIREMIMPINRKFKIKDLIEQCKYYSSVVKEKITLEYVMLRDVNDSMECAKQLIKLMAQFPCKINLIEFHPF